MGNQIIATLKKHSVVPVIVAGAIIVAIPTFVFVLTRLVYERAIREALAPTAAKKLDAWRKGQAEFAFRPHAISLFAGVKVGRLQTSISQVTGFLHRLDRRKDI